MDFEEPPDATKATINPINCWHTARAQIDTHYFIYSDSKGQAFAACGWLALVSDLGEDRGEDSCYRCELVLLALGKEN